MPNAIAMLKSDHATVKRLLRELKGTTDRATKQRERLVADIEREVKIHSQLEEELFYPTFKKAAQDTAAEDLFYDATEEHHVVDMVLPELKSTSPKTPEFDAKCHILKELVESHIREEEDQMFVKARTLLDDRQLRALGEEMQKRKETLAAMWTNPLLKPVKKLQSAVQAITPARIKNAKANAIANMKSDEAGKR
jgi:iron-sulfur cluster repair protein YtfE (RIC family)